jgi:16S rRNA (guanine527-N7)-methyltransferase
VSGQSLAQRIETRARELGLSVSSGMIGQLENYWELLAKWNRRVNLTALPLDGFPAHSVDRLLIEPLVAASSLAVLNSPATWFDFGSGGGSPAIPMKTARPKTVLLMVESRSRKCAFLREVLQALALHDATVFCGRVEELPDTYTHSADLITLRAVKVTQQIAFKTSWALKPGGTLGLFGTEAVPWIPSSPLTYERSIPLTSAQARLQLFKN